MLTDRVQCLQIGCSAPITTTTARNSSPHTLSGSPRRSHTATRYSPQQRVGIAAETKWALHPLRCSTPDTLLYTRYVALHPLRGATPNQKGCNTDGSGAVPTDRVQCPRNNHNCAQRLPTHPVRQSQTQPHSHEILAPAAGWDRSRNEAGTTPVTGQYTRYGAQHPNRRGVMPTDRVQCPHDKSKSGLPCASSLTTSLGQYHAAVDGLAFRSERPTPPAATSLHEPTEAPCGSLLFRRRQDARRALGENPLDDARQARRHFAATQREEAHARPRGDSHAFGPAS